MANIFYFTLFQIFGTEAFLTKTTGDIRRVKMEDYPGHSLLDPLPTEQDLGVNSYESKAEKFWGKKPLYVHSPLNLKLGKCRISKFGNCLQLSKV